ncbi:MAG: hypothetical protein ACQEQV_01795 [Fibrobacterota bacterium]
MKSVKFEAGSTESEGSFFKTILRSFSTSEGTWTRSAVLIQLARKYQNREEAALHAKADIDTARYKAEKNRGRYTMDHYLAALGYQKLEQE